MRPERILTATQFVAAGARGLAMGHEQLCSWGPEVGGKVDVIQNLLGKVDTLILGGGMIFTFLKVQGMNIGLRKIFCWMA